MAKNKIEVESPIYSALVAQEHLQKITQYAQDTQGEYVPSILANKIVHLEAALRDIEDEFDKFKAAVNKVKTETLPRVFEDHDTTSITVLGYRVTVSAQIRATVRPGERRNAITWLEVNGYQDIIDYDPSVNSSTLAATVRSEMEEGKSFPEEVFNVYTFNNTSLTKAR